MANPAVDKLKDFGIQHGEKVGVALVSALCLAMFWLALSRPTVEYTKEQIEQSTQRAQQNLNNPQKPEEIVAKIRGEGVVQPEFIKVVDRRQSQTIDATPYRLGNVIASPEPGAGLLREMPELVAIASVQTHAGRGAIRILETDPNTGEVIYEVPKADEPKPKSKRKGAAGRNTMADMMAGMMGRQGGAGSGGQLSDRQKAEAERARREEEARLRRGVAGNLATREQAAAPEPEREPGAEPKSRLRGFRWVAVTGVVDNRKLRESYARALKLDMSTAYPHYLRVDLERQERRDDGTWSRWTPVDRKYSKEQVLELLTDVEAETGPSGAPITPTDVRLEELVDPLPFLEAGYWVGVHHGELIDPDALKVPDDQGTGGGALAGRGSGAMGSGGMMMGRGMAGSGMGPDMEGMMMRGGAGRMVGGSGGMMGGASGGMMGRGLGGMGLGDESMGSFGNFFGGGGQGSAADTNFNKSDADKIMVRALDFTVEPDRFYRYRVRLVVRNPNLGVDNVIPGVDNKSPELFGPWTEAPTPVNVAPDVETYVAGVPPSDARRQRPDVLQFNVVRWNNESGHTIVKPFYEAPGDIIGQPENAAIPVEDKDKLRLGSRQIDFTSNRALVDTAGGQIPLERLGLGAGFFNSPATALLLRPDGRIELRDEAGDHVSGAMAEMVAIYAQERKDAEAGQKESSDLPFGGSLGGMGGMMGASGF